jgi:Flp pilus assembly pilin Flp
MFKKLIKNKKAQQTAEYALLISLVVAAVIAMQTYAQRTIQGRIRDAGDFLTAQTSGIGNTEQYEPYYLTTDYNVYRDDVTRKRRYELGDADEARDTIDKSTNRTRAAGGSQVSVYTQYGLVNGL